MVQKASGKLTELLNKAIAREIQGERPVYVATRDGEGSGIS